jgi:hypothetical protein
MTLIGSVRADADDQTSPYRPLLLCPVCRHACNPRYPGSQRTIHRFRHVESDNPHGDNLLRAEDGGVAASN